MSGIIIPNSVDNSAMPMDGGQRDAILANAGLIDWYQSDSEFLMFASGKIATWASLKSGGRTLTQGSAGGQASLAAQAALANYDAAVFDGADDRYQWSGTPDFSSTFSLVFGLSSAATGATQGVAMQRTLSSQQTGMAKTSAGALVAYHKASALGIGTPVNAQANLAIMGVTGSTLKGKLNNLAVVSAAVTGSLATANLMIGSVDSGGGSPFNGWISDIMIWNVDLLSAGNELALAAVQEYFAGTYGIATS